jgi:hypothetical protein
MKKILLLIITILSFIISFSQDNKCDDIVFKNGEELFAKVLEISSSEIKYKKCDNPQGPTYSLEKEKVLMIKYKNGTKDIFNNIEEKISRKKSNDFQKDNSSGYKGFLLAGFCAGVDYYGESRIKFDVINGYKFNSQNFIGLGTGFRFQMRDGDIILPIYLNFNHSLLGQKISPYFSISAGQGIFIGYGGLTGGSFYFPVSGFYASSSVGVDIALENRASFYIGLGYEYQNDLVDYFSDGSFILGNNGAISIDFSYSF